MVVTGVSGRMGQMLVQTINGNARAELVVQVGKIKRKSGSPIYAPHREQAVLKKVQALNKGPLAAKTLEALYRELMSGSFHLEQPLRIGYLGPIGSYSHLAASRRLRGYACRPGRAGDGRVLWQCLPAGQLRRRAGDGTGAFAQGTAIPAGSGCPAFHAVALHAEAAAVAGASNKSSDVS